MENSDQNNSPSAVDAGPAQDVFLSYSRDDRPRAAKIKGMLEAAGISVWWDDMLEGGTRFLSTTEYHLENCAAVVVLWSEISVTSHWVSDEATRGRDRGVLVPVTIDGTMPPLGFRQFQVLDLANPDAPSYKAEAQKLINSVAARRTAGGGETSSKPALGSVAPTSVISAQPKTSRRGALIGGGAAIVGLAGVAAWQGGVFGSGDAAIKRVAVMPFDIENTVPEQKSLLASIASEVRTRLSRNPLLHVAAQTSSRALKDAGKTASEICEELQVDYLITGRASLQGQRIDVSGELIEGQTDRTVLPIDIVGPIASVLSLQSKIVSDVIRELTSADDEDASAKAGGTEIISAYDAFLRGSELYASGLSEETDRGALAKFDEAIAIDPAYAAAHAMRGRTLALIANLYGNPGEIAAMYEEAAESAREATRQAPQYAGGHGVLGDILANRQLNMKAARGAFETSAQLGQGSAELLIRFAIYQGRMGDFVEARKATSSALALDPLNPGVFRLAGRIEYDSGAYDAALRHLNTSLTIQENTSYTNYLVGITHLAMGDHAAAKAAFEAERRFVWKKTGLSIADHKLGNIAAAQDHFAELKERQGAKSSYQYMQIHAQWGEQEAALDALDAAWAARDSGLVEARNDPLLDPIRGTDRFAATLAQIGFV